MSFYTITKTMKLYFYTFFYFWKNQRKIFFYPQEKQHLFSIYAGQESDLTKKNKKQRKPTHTVMLTNMSTLSMVFDMISGR